MKGWNKMKKKNLICIILLTFFLMSVSTINLSADAKINLGNTLEDIKQKLDLLLGDYGIKFQLGKFSPSETAIRWAHWKYLTDNDVKTTAEFVNVFIEEWSKYPVDFIKKTNLKEIVFVKDLTVSGQKRKAMPDYVGEAVYYDITSGNGLYAQYVIHHEFYHNVEEDFFGDVYFFDPIWNSYNEDDFEYGQGGYTAYEGVDMGELRKGFVTNYSMYGLEEDKAEVFSHLMVAEYYYITMEMIKQDEILRNKVTYMVNFLNEISPEMDWNYFKRINRQHNNIKNTISEEFFYESGSFIKVSERVWIEKDQNGNVINVYEESYREGDYIYLWKSAGRMWLTLPLKNGTQSYYKYIDKTDGWIEYKKMKKIK